MELPKKIYKKKVKLPAVEKLAPEQRDPWSVQRREKEERCLRARHPIVQVMLP